MKASVIFERPDPRYLAGEVLRGSVSIQNPDPIQLRCKFIIVPSGNNVALTFAIDPYRYLHSTVRSCSSAVVGKEQ